MVTEKLQQFIPGKQKQRSDTLNERIEMKLAQFNELKSIDENLKQELLPKVRLHQEELAKLHVLWIKTKRFVHFLLLILLIASVLFALFARSLAFSILGVKNVQIHIEIGIGNIFLLVLLFIVLMLLATVPNYIQRCPDWFVFGWTVSFLIFYLVGSYFIGTGYPQLAQSYSSMLVDGIFLALIAASLSWFGFYIILLIILLVRISIGGRRTSRYPLAVLIDNLVLILKDAEDNPGQIDLAYKLRQISRLEVAAKSIGYYIPRVLGGGDLITKLWLRKVSQQVATALREKKKSILMPEEESYDAFIQKIAETLTIVLKGNWGTLDKMDLGDLMKEDNLTRPQVWSSHIFSSLRTIYVSLAPLGILLLVRYFFNISPEIFNILIIPFVLLAVVGLGFAFDTNFGEKLGPLKEMIPGFPSPGKDKEDQSS